MSSVRRTRLWQVAEGAVYGEQGLIHLAQKKPSLLIEVQTVALPFKQRHAELSLEG